MEELISAVILFVAMIVICKGKNKWDDNLHLFVVKNAGRSEISFAHKIADIKSFGIVMDKNYINTSESILIDGGHIEIRLKEPVDKVNVYYSSKRDSLGARLEVKKALEPDLKFLKEVTGIFILKFLL